MNRSKKVGYTYYGERRRKAHGHRQQPEAAPERTQRKNWRKRFPEGENRADDQTERPALGKGPKEHQRLLTQPPA